MRCVLPPYAAKRKAVRFIFDLWQLIRKQKKPDGFFHFRKKKQMIVINVINQSDFTQIKNQTLRDRRLSAEARGVLCYLLSHTESFKITRKNLMLEFGFARAKLLRITNELKENGYLQITPKKNGADFDGAEWTVFGVSQNVSFRPEKTAFAREAQFSGCPETGTPGNCAANKNTEVLKITSKGIRSLKDNAPGTGNAATYTHTREPEAATAPFPAFGLIANLCFFVPVAKADFVGKTQKAEINESIKTLENLGADFSRLESFGDFWRNHWKSFDRLYQKYQPPRPQQIAETWFEFINSPAETARREQIENELKIEQELKKNDKRNGIKTDADDFRRFDTIEFDE